MSKHPRRPSEAQLEVLKRLLNRKEYVHRCSHTTVNTPDSYFYHSGYGIERIPAVTMRTLEERGWVEDFEEEGWRWRGSKYRITEEGRKVCREKR